MTLIEKINELLFDNIDESDIFYYSYMGFFAVFAIGHLIILFKVWM